MNERVNLAKYFFMDKVKTSAFDRFTYLLLEAYLEPTQTSTIQLTAKYH